MLLYHKLQFFSYPTEFALALLGFIIPHAESYMIPFCTENRNSQPEQIPKVEILAIIIGHVKIIIIFHPFRRKTN
jgi:hypothetical protein